MQDQEYERLRRGIEERLAADLELIHAAHQARLQALDALRLASADPQAPKESPPSVTQTAPVEEPGGRPAAVQKLRRGGLLADIREIFGDLPEAFDKADVVRLLGYEPNRPSLHRAWDKLRDDGKIVMERFSAGRRPTRFRKVGAK
ncbi:MAG TPA: hypothetical protein VIE43_22825 [Thermoanaerobaculia bacterium]|nr:hypothetical protein [Thermoanaerobaculia bacterium]